jgi:hypothetical protein
MIYDSLLLLACFYVCFIQSDGLASISGSLCNKASLGKLVHLYSEACFHRRFSIRHGLLTQKALLFQRLAYHLWFSPSLGLLHGKVLIKEWLALNDGSLLKTACYDPWFSHGTRLTFNLGSLEKSAYFIPRFT